MALINGSLQIGGTALAASQAALSVTGNNIANSATEGYSRQVPHLTPTQYYEVLPGQYTGTGVSIYDIQRVTDEAINARLRNATGDSASYLIQQQTMSRVESAFNELTEDDISSRLNNFFAAWSQLQIQPQDVASRNVVLQNADSISNVIHELRYNLKNIHDDLNSQVKSSVAQADTLAKEIAAINGDIVATEAGRAGSASALRDQRDDMLRQLNELVNISTQEQPGGSVTVYVGNEPLVQFTDCRGLSYRDVTNENGEKVTEVVFENNQGLADLSTGRISGLITARDELVDSVIADMDSWSQSLIYEVNKLHSVGSSMEKVTSVKSDYNVENANGSLADASSNGLNWDVTNGIFNVTIFDSTGDVITEQQIKVDVNAPANDTLNSVVAKLDAINGLDASVDGAGYLTISTSSSGDSFAFSAKTTDDGMVDFDSTSNFLAVMGINTFFSGSSANDIALKEDMYNHPEKIVAGDYALGKTGDGSIASQIASLATEGVSSLNGISLPDNFTSMVAEIASNTRRVEDNYSAAEAVLETLKLEQQGVSGVSVDEEAMNMIIYQRAYQGAANYIGVIDQLLDEVIGLIR